MIVLKHQPQLKWRKATPVKYTHMRMWCDDGSHRVLTTLDFECIHADKTDFHVLVWEQRQHSTDCSHMVDSCFLLYQGMTERNYAVFLHEDGLNLENAYYFAKVWFLPPQPSTLYNTKYIFICHLLKNAMPTYFCYHTQKYTREILRWNNRYKCPNLWK